MIHLDKMRELFARDDPTSALAVLKESKNADERREAIERLRSPGALDANEVVSELGAIAQADENPMVRCAAIRALGQSRNGQAAELLAQVIERLAEARPTQESREVRADAYGQLAVLAEAGRAGDVALAPCLGPAVNTLAKDPAREARLGAARLLGHIRSPQSVETLIGAMQQRDFGIVYEAERALSKLTGQRFQYDVQAWKEWASQNPQALAAVRGN